MPSLIITKCRKIKVCKNYINVNRASMKKVHKLKKYLNFYKISCIFFENSAYKIKHNSKKLKI